MTVYIPASYEDEDYRPSWTGNSTYPTVTIRGIFDSYEKAEHSIKGWACKDDYVIEERYFEDDDGEELYFDSFDIDYDDKYLYVWGKENGNGYYKLNEVTDEDYSAVYDEHGQLGVTDY